MFEQPLALGVECRGEQLLLGLEVAVQRRLCDARVVGDLVHRDAVEALPRERGRDGRVVEWPARA